MWHSACAHFDSVTNSRTIIFGGNKHRDTNEEKHVMSDLTEIHFGKAEGTVVGTLFHYALYFASKLLTSIGVLQLKTLCLESIRREGLEELLESCPHWAKNLYRDYSSSQFYHLS